MIILTLQKALVAHSHCVRLLKGLPHLRFHNLFLGQEASVGGVFVESGAAVAIRENDVDPEQQPERQDNQLRDIEAYGQIKVVCGHVEVLPVLVDWCLRVFIETDVDGVERRRDRVRVTHDACLGHLYRVQRKDEGQPGQDEVDYIAALADEALAGQAAAEAERASIEDECQQLPEDGKEATDEQRVLRDIVAVCFACQRDVAELSLALDGAFCSGQAIEDVLLGDAIVQAAGGHRQNAARPREDRKVLEILLSVKLEVWRVD